MESAARDLNDRPDIPFIDSEDTETRLGKLYIFLKWNFLTNFFKTANKLT